MQKHFTPGRSGHKIECIVRHHNAGVLTTEQCWEIWQDRPASAHYQVEVDGTIGQLVNDWDTAWHAANATINAKSIGIEHANCGGQAQGWPISDKTIEEGAHLAAALCVYYKLGRPIYGKNIRDHKEFTSTTCPHHLAAGGQYHDRWMARAQYWYDHMTNPPKAKETAMSFNHIHQDALNEAKVASWKARDNSADNRVQLRGPNDKGWPQLGGRTLVDAIGALGAKLGMADFSDRGPQAR